MEEREEVGTVTVSNYNNFIPPKGPSTPNLSSDTAVHERENKGFTEDNNEMVPETMRNESRVEDEVKNDATNLQEVEGTGASKKLKETKPGPASVSCVIQLKTMWYNFAAPPQAPITRKIDYTRYVVVYDWNINFRS